MYSQYGWFSPTGVAVSSSAGPGAAPDGPRRPDRAAHGPSWPGLQASALRGRDVVILSLASAGPAQSIAVTLAALLAAVGYASFLPLLICFIPMLGIAVGYQRLNAWQPSAGATYSWVGRALGIKLSAGFQWGWAIFEYGLLVGFAIAAIAGIYGGHLTHAVHLTSSWFTLSGAGGFRALISGVLLAIFLYSGWDTAAYVGEEAKDKQAGAAAVTSVILLFFIYAVAILAFQGVAPGHVLQANAANILAYVGQQIGGGFWKQLMIVAVLGGTLASLQAAIVSSSRISFAIGSSPAGSAPSARSTGRRGTRPSCSVF